jgi:PAS domain S-box-containing protein
MTVSSQKLLDRIPHIAWLMSDSGEIFTINQQWCNYLGTRSPDQEYPWLFAEILHDEERESCLSAWQEARRSQTVLKVKIQLQSYQGNWEWMQLELDYDCDNLGQTNWIGTAIRLREEATVPSSQTMEIALQASESLFRQTFERTPLGFAHVALDGSLLRINQKFCEIVGYTQAELLATTFQAITEPVDLAEDLDLVAQLVNGEIDEYTLEKRYIHKQGHHVWVNLTVALIRSIAPAGQRGTPQYFLGAVKDITDRKQLEILSQTQTVDLKRLNNSLILAQQQLQIRNQELDRFVSIAAHDLKAPLRAIANLSAWIEEDLQTQMPGENPQLQLLRQRVQRMDALIDGLLRYSRAGRADLTTETVDVAQLLAETIDSLSPPASFEIKIASLMPILNTKRLLLSQVFANLINNAIKHHDRADGRIEITAEDLGDCDQFSIADDGPGIPKGESRERIFEIFQTLHPTTDSTQNTGIGLALVRKIVEGEGGEIWLDAADSQGCRFCFTWLKTAMPSQHRL